MLPLPPKPTVPQRPEEILETAPSPGRSEIFDAVARSDEVLTGLLIALGLTAPISAAVLLADGRALSVVLALVGSENYFAPGTGQVNGAWSPRSAGSTIKPFTYLLALERGATPASVAARLARSRAFCNAAAA